VSGPVDHIDLTFNNPVQNGSFTLASVDSFTGPAGAIQPSAVTKLSDTQYEVTFPVQSVAGTYTLIVGPHIKGLDGKEMDQNGNGVPGEDPGDRYSTTFIIAASGSHFDFGTTGSPVASGYTRVTEQTRYSSGLHYGWLSGTIDSRDRLTGSDLNRDFDFTTQGTFAVDLANGTYNVTLTVGDNDWPQTTMGVSFQGTQVDSFSVAAGQYAQKTYSVTVSNGQLDLGLAGLAGSGSIARINGLDILS
jgi:hypothetical protein